MEDLKKGKKYIRIVPAVVGVILVGSLCVNGYIYNQTTKVNGAISDTQERLDGLTSESDFINSEITDKQAALDLIQKEVATIQEDAKPITENENKSVSESAIPGKKAEQPAQQDSKNTTASSTAPPKSSSKGGTDIDGDGTIDFDANGDLIPGSSVDKNGNGIKDWYESPDGSINDGIVRDASGSGGGGSEDYELDTH